MITQKKSGFKKALKVGALFAFVLALCAVFASCGKNVELPLGNSINYGYVLADGNDVYYSKVIENDVDYYTCIYKYNTQSNKDTLIATLSAEENNVMNSFLTIDGGKLYFLSNYMHESYLEAGVNINYIDLNGSNPDKVSTIFDTDEISCRYMQIVNGMIYYYDDMEEIIYRMNLNGTDRKSVCEAVISSYSIMCVSKNKIYYSEDEFIYEVNVRGGTPKIVFDSAQEFEDDYFDIGYLTVDGSYIYYMDYDKSFIQRIGTNGSGNTMMYEAPQGAYIESFNVSDGVIYFVLNSSEAYTIMSVVPGNQTSRVVVDESHGYAEILPMSIWGDTIYYLALPAYETIMESDYVWFTVKKSGGNVTPMSPFSVYASSFGDGNWSTDGVANEDDEVDGEEVETEAEVEGETENSDE